MRECPQTPLLFNAVQTDVIDNANRQGKYTWKKEEVKSLHTM